MKDKTMEKKRRITILFLVLVMVLCSILPGMSVHATTKRIATLTGDLNLREKPSVSADVVGTVKKGESYEILDEEDDDRKPPVTWYKINADGIKGWISSSYVKVTEEKDETEQEPGINIETEEDFERYLEKQGFPEKYKVELRKLHAKYPKWIFQAQHIEHTWQEALEGQCRLGRNVVLDESIASWKSTQTGAYNWEKGYWLALDTGGWVQASEEIIAFYMDPRNFLDDTYVFQFLKQSYDADSMTKAEKAAKKADLKNMVSGTFLAGTYTDTASSKEKISYVSTLMSVAAKSGVDPLMLASMILQEQGSSGKGLCISGNITGYKGYYNYFNIGAYAANGMTAVQRGLWYASGSGNGQTSYERPWNTRTKALLGGARYYGETYVNLGQDTMYLKKFNVQGDSSFLHQFMANVAGGAIEGKHVAEGYDNSARDTALVFKIPVYEGMPKKPVPEPIGDEDPNYMLKSLTVSGCKLTPTFDIYETSYATTVENDVESVEISATTVSKTTKVKGLGTKFLEVGENKFTIKTTAENGDTRKYTVTIVRKSGPNNTKPVSMSSDVYTINENNTITGITTFPVDEEAFLANMEVKNGYAKVVNADGSSIEGNVGTGMQVQVYNVKDVCKYTYDVIIYGDANGDGNINAKDLLVIQKNNIKVKELDGVYLIAADVNRDGVVNAKDLLLVQKNNIKISSIEQ